MYIVQYKYKYGNGWVFTGREFTLLDRDKAINSLKGVRHSYPDNEWRLVWVEVTVIKEDM